MRIFIGILLGVVALLAGCGDSEESTASRETSSAKEATTTTTSKPDKSQPEIAASDWRTLREVAGKHATRLIIPSGPAPEKIVIKDLRVGTGRKLEPERIFKVKYLALDYTTGEVEQKMLELPFEAGWRLDELVGSFEVGLKGMRAGGIRQMIAPSYLVYNQGAMVYWIKLLEVGRKGWD